MSTEQPADEQRHPLPPPVLLHLVVDDTGHLQRTTLNEVRAHEQARHIGGLVAALPVSGDYRPQPEPEHDPLADTVRSVYGANWRDATRPKGDDE